MHEQMQEFVRMQEQCRAEPQNWALFFEAGELWTTISDALYADCRTAEQRSRVWWLLRDIEREVQPGFWERLRRRFMKRG